MTERSAGAEEVRLTLTPTPDPRATAIRIARGLLDRIPSLLAEHAPAARYAVISDSNVSGLYGERIRSALREGGREATLFEFPAGEASKTLETWSRLVEELAESRLGRDACIVAVGGGVTGDLAGFAAAAYTRGVPLVQVPTSLLAMIDAAIGGKTGVDLRAGKNLAGAFHDPAAVLIDPHALDTLPPQEVRSGLAEAVKHGAIADLSYFRDLRALAAGILALEAGPVDRLVSRSVELKVAIVERDARETGERAALNFGHTIAHGIERVTGYAVGHGQAVAMGMVAEARIGEAIGLTRPGTAGELADVLAALELPVRLPLHVDPLGILEAAASDKKGRAGRTRYTLIAEPGRVARASDGEWTHPVPDADVLPVLVELGAGERGGSAV